MTREAPVGRHLLSDTASIEPNDHLSIAGVDVMSLVDSYGTPLFVYDQAHIEARCREAVACFGHGVAYGTKAFLCKAMARLVADEQMMLDVSTAGEFAVVRAAGVPADRIIYHGNNKSDDELASAVGERVHHVIVDSFDEIERLRRITASRAGDPQAVFVRVTPGIEAHTHEYVMTGQEDSKFGFSLASGAAAEAITAIESCKGLALTGLHAHIGSQIFRLDAFEQAIGALAPLVASAGVNALCIGGGLGVAYLNEERAPSITDWAETLHGACADAGVPDEVQVTAEPGRAIIASAGLTCYRVGTIKTLPDIRTYVAVDGGMSDNPRPVLYGSGYEAFLARATSAERPLACRVVGKHCESGDVLIADARLPRDLQLGDVLVTPVTGAYGYAMSSNYNRIPRPAVLFVREGDTRVVLRRETPDDLLRLEA